MKASGTSMSHRLMGILAAIALTLILLYASRFWIWTAPWPNDGLFGLKLFPPRGDVVRWWLRGTPFNEFAIVIWGCGAILLLSVLQWLASRFGK